MVGSPCHAWVHVAYPTQDISEDNQFLRHGIEINVTIQLQVPCQPENQCVVVLGHMFLRTPNHAEEHSKNTSHAPLPEWNKHITDGWYFAVGAIT